MTFPLLIEKNEGLAVIKHKDSLTMARRRKNRRGRDRKQDVPEIVSLEAEVQVDLPLDADAIHRMEEEAFEHIENDCCAIHELWERASPTERKLILLLSEWQQNKAMGECTKHLRQKLYLLKKQLKREGSTFNPKPWML